MQYWILICTNLVLLLFFAACSAKSEDETYIYEYLNRKDQSLGYYDSLVVQNSINGVKHLSFIKSGTTIKFKVIETDNLIRLFRDDTTIVIYSTTDEEIRHNNLLNDEYCPYLAVDSKLNDLKEYILNDKKYKVFLFSLKNNFAHNDFVYYSPGLGFLILVTDGDECKKLVKISNTPNPDSNIAIKLTEAVFNDSTFYIPKIPIIKTHIIFEVPK